MEYQSLQENIIFLLFVLNLIWSNFISQIGSSYITICMYMLSISLSHIRIVYVICLVTFIDEQHINIRTHEWSDYQMSLNKMMSFVLHMQCEKTEHEWFVLQNSWCMSILHQLALSFPFLFQISSSSTAV